MRKNLQASLAVAVAALGFLAVPALPASARAMVPPNVGVTFQPYNEADAAAQTAVLDKMAAARVGWIRLDIGWANLEANGRGKMAQRYVDEIDRTVNEAQARGIKVLGILWNTPKWANGGKAGTVPPNDPRDYARIARWAAKHFTGRVAAWEVWNEPTADHFWQGDVPSYVALVRAAYPAFKAGDPQATVVVGSTIFNDDKWLTEAYDAGLGGAFDAISTHPYMGPSNAPPDLVDNGTIWRMDHVRAVRELMVARGDGAKPIWFTEFGWSAHENQPGAPPWEFGVSESQQADYLLRALDQIAERYPYVSHVFWYNARDTNSGKPHHDHSGLLRRDYSERPVYEALKSALDPASVVPSTTSTTLVTSVATPVSSGRLLGSMWWLGVLAPLAAGAALQQRRRFGFFDRRSRRIRRRLS